MISRDGVSCHTLRRSAWSAIAISRVNQMPAEAVYRRVRRGVRKAAALQPIHEQGATVFACANQRRTSVAPSPYLRDSRSLPSQSQLAGKHRTHMPKSAEQLLIRVLGDLMHDW